MKVRLMMSVKGNDDSLVGTVARDFQADGIQQVVAAAKEEANTLITSVMAELVIKKGELHDAVAGVPADKLYEGVVAMKEYKERTERGEAHTGRSGTDRLADDGTGPK